MLIGIILALVGIFLMWQVSMILGALFVAAGIVKVGLDFMTREPEVATRDYEAGARTYNLKSTYKK